MLTYPKPSQFFKFCENLSVIGQQEHRPVALELNFDQKYIIKEILKRPFYDKQDPRALVLKARQIGSSTVLIALLVMLSIINPGIEILIVAQKLSTSRRLLLLAKGFLDQVKVELSQGGVDALTIADTKSRLLAVATTGNAEGREADVGRGFSPSVLLISEAAYLSNSKSINSLLNTTTGAVFLESTSAGESNRFAQLYQQENSWQKIFVSFEQHEAYRLPEDYITDEEWETCESTYGFTRRDSAAYWMQKLKDGGLDLGSHLRDYPLSASQAFATFGGQFITVLPQVVQPLAYLSDDISIFEHPTPTKVYRIGVDIAWGRGKDASAFVVVDGETCQIVASYRNNLVHLDDYLAKIKAAYDYFKADTCHVESNGGGFAAIQELQRANVRVIAVHTGKEKYALFLKVKRAIESGFIYGPKDLQDECLSCSRDSKGNFIGKDDLISALSFVVPHIELFPHRIDPEREPGRVYYDEILKRNHKPLWV